MGSAIKLWFDSVRTWRFADPGAVGTVNLRD